VPTLIAVSAIPHQSKKSQKSKASVQNEKTTGCFAALMPTLLRFSANPFLLLTK
jgi:hypothetical protein